jgi:phage major head subunit gpT-like protein
MSVFRDLEPKTFRNEDLGLFNLLIMELDNVTTTKADHMVMMVIASNLKTSHATTKLMLDDKATLNKNLHGSVNGCVANLWCLNSNFR